MVTEFGQQSGLDSSLTGAYNVIIVNPTFPTCPTSFKVSYVLYVPSCLAIAALRILIILFTLNLNTFYKNSSSVNP